MPYKVSIVKVNTDEKIVTDATVTMMGLIELLHHFIDISNEDWVRFMQDLTVYQSCSVMGPGDMPSIFEIKATSIPNITVTYEEPRKGFWQWIRKGFVW